MIPWPLPKPFQRPTPPNTLRSKPAAFSIVWSTTRYHPRSGLCRRAGIEFPFYRIKRLHPVREIPSMPLLVRNGARPNSPSLRCHPPSATTPPSHAARISTSPVSFRPSKKLRRLLPIQHPTSEPCSLSACSRAPTTTPRTGPPSGKMRSEAPPQTSTVASDPEATTGSGSSIASRPTSPSICSSLSSSTPRCPATGSPKNIRPTDGMSSAATSRMRPMRRRFKVQPM